MTSSLMSANRTILLGGVCLYLLWQGSLLHLIWLSANILETLRAVRTSRPNRRRIGVQTRRRAMKLVLTGWIVMAIVSQVDPIISRIFGWIPFYAPLKWITSVLFLLVRVPASTVVYTSALRPFIRNYETPIDLGLLLLHSFAALIQHYTIELPIEQLRRLYEGIRRRLKGTSVITVIERSAVKQDVNIEDQLRFSDRGDTREAIVVVAKMPAVRTSDIGDISLATPILPGRFIRPRRSARFDETVSRAQIGESSSGAASSLIDAEAPTQDSTSHVHPEITPINTQTNDARSSPTLRRMKLANGSASVSHPSDSEAIQYKNVHRGFGLDRTSRYPVSANSADSANPAGIASIGRSLADQDFPSSSLTALPHQFDIDHDRQNSDIVMPDLAGTVKRVASSNTASSRVPRGAVRPGTNTKPIETTSGPRRPIPPSGGENRKRKLVEVMDDREKLRDTKKVSRTATTTSASVSAIVKPSTSNGPGTMKDGATQNMSVSTDTSRNRLRQMEGTSKSGPRAVVSVSSNIVRSNPTRNGDGDDTISSHKGDQVTLAVKPNRAVGRIQSEGIVVGNKVGSRSTSDTIYKPLASRLEVGRVWAPSVKRSAPVREQSTTVTKKARREI